MTCTGAGPTSSSRTTTTRWRRRVPGGRHNRLSARKAKAAAAKAARKAAAKAAPASEMHASQRVSRCVNPFCVVQAEAFHGNKQWVNYFLHAGHLNIQAAQHHSLERVASPVRTAVTVRAYSPSTHPSTGRHARVLRRVSDRLPASRGCTVHRGSKCRNRSKISSQSARLFPLRRRSAPLRPNDCGRVPFWCSGAP